MDKGAFVKDIVDNTRLDGIFVVSGAELKQTRSPDPRPYWNLRLADATGEIDAKIWHPKSLEFKEILPGILARVCGRTSQYNKMLQVSLDRFEPLDETQRAQMNPKYFTRCSVRDVDEMFGELRDICVKEFTYPAWRAFIFSLFRDTPFKSAFKKHPAAKKIHHAYEGGLLEHTLGVMKICLAFADQYQKLDRQTLLAGALLHDIGKIREFSGGLNNEYTDEGSLLGHTFLGLEMLTPFMANSDLEAQLREHLKHLILSHHGEYAYGSARLPMTAEAFALHYADNIDAKMNQCEGLFEDVKDEASVWSPWQRTFERSIFRPYRTPCRSQGSDAGYELEREEQCS